MSEFAVRTVDFLLEMILVLLFFLALPRDPSTPPMKVALGCLCLLLLGPIFFLGSGLLAAFFRILCRCCVFFCYLKFAKGLSGEKAIYCAALGALCFTIANNTWNLPCFYVLQQGAMSLMGSPALGDFVVQCLLRYTVAGAVLLIPYFSIPFDQIEKITVGRALLLTSAIAVEVFVKETIYVVNMGDGAPYLQFSIYLMLLHLFVMMFVVAVERTFCGNEQRVRLMQQETANSFRLRSLKVELSQEKDMRILHHDMKNHLIAIRDFVENGNLDDAIGYMDEIEQKLGVFERRFKTGSDLVDGLLSQKASESAQDKIRFSVDLKIPSSLAKSVPDADLCTVFGNLVDNAIEATRLVEPPANRFVLVKGRERAGLFFISVSNSRKGGHLALQSGFPVTSKRDARSHGFGLRSVADVASRYGGALTLDCDKDNTFEAVFSMPYVP